MSPEAQIALLWTPPAGAAAPARPEVRVIPEQSYWGLADSKGPIAIGAGWGAATTELVLELEPYHAQRAGGYITDTELHFFHLLASMRTILVFF